MPSQVVSLRLRIMKHATRGNVIRVGAVVGATWLLIAVLAIVSVYWSSPETVASWFLYSAVTVFVFGFLANNYRSDLRRVRCQFVFGSLLVAHTILFVRFEMHLQPLYFLPIMLIEYLVCALVMILAGGAVGRLGTERRSK